MAIINRPAVLGT